jgi:5-(carboxyamino)imidazole ribonucleotide synthase
MFYRENNIPTADFLLVEDLEDLKKKAPLMGFPCVQKLGREGYDGRGVMKLNNLSDCDKGFEKPSLVEADADIKKEISVIVARNESGEMRTFPCVEVVYHPSHNLTDYLIAPADISADEEQRAEALALLVVEKMNFIGLLAVEMFLTNSGEILVNEVAPRPHNSGHQSIEGNVASQFEQHLRAVADLPLADTSLRGHSAMLNLLGSEGFTGDAHYEGLEEALKLPGVYVHLYGKKTTKPFRKMGHVTIIGSTRSEVVEKMETVKKFLRVISKTSV